MRWIPIIGLIACGTPWEEGDRAGLKSFTVLRDANKSGSLRVAFEPEPGDTSLQFVIRPFQSTGGAHSSHVHSLEVDKEPVYRAVDEVDPMNAFSRSSAGFLATATSMNWPIAPEDGPLQTGVRHVLRGGIADSTRAYTDGLAEVTVLVKSDDDLTSGTLLIDLYFGGVTATDPDLQQAIGQAVDTWRTTYRTIGLELDIEQRELPQSSLGPPGQADPATYEAFTATSRPGAVNMLVLEEIVDFPTTLGFAGGIPGPIIPSNLSAVVVNTTLSAGQDGLFSPAEITLLGETMAHEVGHYLGLFHPVERTFDSWDALEDTPQCGAEVECNDVLGGNLMFPVPICDGATCVTQQTLSDTQAAVIHRYIGVQ